MISLIKSLLYNKYPLYQSDNNFIQVVFPAFAEDSDLYEIYVKQTNEDEYLVTDRGVVLMRLSYSYEINTDNKRQLLNRIISSNGGNIRGGEIQIISSSTNLEESLFRLLQISAKVSNMSLYSKETVKNLFMEDLVEFVKNKFVDFNPRFNYLPINNSPEYVVDFYFESINRPLYLFGVSSSEKARLVTISCQKFKLEKINHHSVVIFDDYSKIGQFDYERLTNASDKTITNFYNNKLVFADYMFEQLPLN